MCNLNLKILNRFRIFVHVILGTCCCKIQKLKYLMGIEKPINRYIPTRCTHLNDIWKPWKDMWETKQDFNRGSLWVLHGIPTRFHNNKTKGVGWKKNLRMCDEVFEGTIHGWKLGADLWDMAPLISPSKY